MSNRRDRQSTDESIFNNASGYFSDESDNGAASSRSLASSAHDFRFENGRRYHGYKDGTHIFPNDDLNAKHEKYFHHLCLRLLEDRLYLAPLDRPKNVLDLGTGTGLWAMDFADQHEDTAHVRGIDLSPVTRKEYQNNVEFQVDDMQEEWTYPVKFDFIHFRSMFASISDWTALYKKCFDNMTSGGYIEQLELEIAAHCDDGTMPANSAILRWVKVAEDLSNASGFDGELFVAQTMKDRATEAGFVDVTQRRFKVPLWGWPSDPKQKELGDFYEQWWRTGMNGWIMAPATRYMGWTKAQADELVDHTLRLFDERKEHVYYHFIVMYARKP